MLYPRGMGRGFTEDRRAWLADTIRMARFSWLALTLWTAILGGCSESVPDPRPLSLSGPVDHLASVAVREPMVVEHQSGALFVAGYTQAIEESLRPPKLFRSVDGAKTWRPVDVGTVEQGALGNSDVDLAVAPDGALYFLTMGFDRAKGEGTHVSVGVSRDVGQTWTWTLISRDRFDDRPWIAVAPNGVARVIWNDGEGVRLAVSEDGGGTWTERPRIHPKGLSSCLAGGPKGEMAVRITPVSASGNRYHEGVDLIALSVDGGATWTKVTAPGKRIWSADFAESDGVRRWVEPLAWDSEGALYYLWSEGSALRLARTVDLGLTWQDWTVLTGPGPFFYPFLTARGPGELAATWFSGVGDDLRANVALIQLNGNDVSLRRAPPFQIDSWTRTAEPVRDPGGEYLPVVFLATGDLGVVAPIQNVRVGRRGFSWYTVGK